MRHHPAGNRGELVGLAGVARRQQRAEPVGQPYWLASLPLHWPGRCGLVDSGFGLRWQYQGWTGQPGIAGGAGERNQADAV